jgi:beta-glucanase (GH16 family)
MRGKLIMIGMAACIAATAAAQAVPGNGWKLAWIDDFEAPAIDTANWCYDLGAGGWGNGESECYSSRPENARVEDGCLVIEARREKYQGSYYTSARLKTQGLRSFKHGRVEARIKVPAGKGLWPAFWLLGSNIPEKGWPDCGEIDVMEYIGKEPDAIFGTIHGPGYSGSLGRSHMLRLSADVADGFHVFAVEWGPGKIDWLCDGAVYASASAQDLDGYEWVFDKDFFIILNLAVGGNWPGPVGLDTAFPARMLVDYVAVYQRQGD